MDVFDTNTPVISWVTARLLLVLSFVMILYTYQVDYTNKFYQVPLDQIVYVELPRVFEQQGIVLEL